MTEFSTYGAGAHVTSLLGMSRRGQSTEGADIFWALGAVTRSVAKVILGSAKARWAILTKRPTSFWA